MIAGEYLEVEEVSDIKKVFNQFDLMIIEGRHERLLADPVEKRNFELVDEAKHYVNGIQPDIMALIEA